MTTLYQHELDQSLVNCGMRYVFQLDDGRFFLIDGGYFECNEEKRLYSFLCDHCEGKPVIAGWFFSHAHQDHIGCFIEFVRSYANDVVIEELCHNFQPYDFTNVVGGWDSDEATFKAFYEAAEACCPQVPVRVLRTGDKVSYGCLEMEVLYTHEDLPQKATFNDCSTVIMLTCEGQRMLFLGDIGTAASAQLLKQAADRLQADLVQVAHHGFNGASVDVYKAADPKVLLWPSPACEVELNSWREENQYLMNHPGISEILYSGKGTAILTLPYVPGTAQRLPRTLPDCPPEK